MILTPRICFELLVIDSISILSEKNVLECARFVIAVDLTGFDILSSEGGKHSNQLLLRSVHFVACS